jgi:hypothetical protein
MDNSGMSAMTEKGALLAANARLQRERDELRAALRFMIEEITDREGREGLTDYEFAEQVIALAQQQREVLERQAL